MTPMNDTTQKSFSLFGPFKQKFNRLYKSEKEHKERENYFIHTQRWGKWQTLQYSSSKQSVSDLIYACFLFTSSFSGLCTLETEPVLHIVSVSITSLIGQRQSWPGWQEVYWFQKRKRMLQNSPHTFLWVWHNSCNLNCPLISGIFSFF